ncbi:hypothetical protein BXZ70DRAFT_922887 [Cristinia sonorae]|uniref:F-box domain-containing protein n=1 Tax=Cristinia sonorae TaxID=1940300 RepID=A0A8K0UUN4_9AGAR|nr:hypothetical protein BXZ70DRAFT_922887 [Cristinia sonorae]
MAPLKVPTIIHNLFGNRKATKETQAVTATTMPAPAVGPPLEKGRVTPPEIDDYIMATIYERKDLQSLRVCGLVCRAWLAASRVYLFRDVTIVNEEMFMRFAEVVLASPIIREYVRNLRIDRSDRKYELTFPWVNNHLSKILPNQLTGLRSFELNTVKEKWKTETFKNLSGFTTVTQLSIIHCSFSPDELFAVISAFPALKDLRVINFNPVYHGRDEPVVFVNKPTPERLTLHCDDIPKRSRDRNSLIDDLLECGSARTIKALDIEVSRANAGEVGRLLRTLGANLEELQLRFVRRYGYYEEDLQSLLDNIDLAENVGLKHLTLPDPAHPATRTFLSRISSSHIRTVTFAFNLYETKAIAKANPELLSRSFASANLARLAEVRFLMAWDPSKVDGVEAAIQNAYPDLHKSGILRVLKQDEYF